MTELQKKLFGLRDEKYAAFEAKLVPGLPAEKFIGVRVPELRALAGEFSKDPSCSSFLRALPHEYHEENLLEAILISKMKGYDNCLEILELFLPYVDNWSVCDTIKPAALAKDRKRLLTDVRRWAESDRTYTCRFGIDMLMTYFLDGAFSPELLEIPAAIHSEEYYVNMMLAWYYATALAKQWDAAVPYIERNRLDAWVHNKTIQKARESFRVSDEHKQYLNSLKRKN